MRVKWTPEIEQHLIELRLHKLSGNLAETERRGANNWDTSNSRLFTNVPNHLLKVQTSEVSETSEVLEELDILREKVRRLTENDL